MLIFSEKEQHVFVPVIKKPFTLTQISERCEGQN